eukprot:TRINITY_DN21298_c0_g1_i1.p1 TRINITY_DN21298_c0_g1~~TRINITY_DN21298_c0_g1_i1.p1  ORF type:complete len:640 (+),score=195.78 TRINITY_DN21298_c0_g1_i1:29-1921(+)
MSGWLRLTVVKGKGLLGTDATGLSDPLVRVAIDGSSAPMKTVDGEPVVTKAKNMTLNPVWNQEFVVPITKSKGVLRFDVWDMPMSMNLTKGLNPVMSAIPLQLNILGDLGDEEFMGRVEVEVGLGTKLGSAGETWLTLKPRNGNEKDKAVWDKKGKGDKNFGEIYVKWYWTYSSLGKILAKDDLSADEEYKEADFELGKLLHQIERFSNWAYNVCLPWWWLSEKFMWTSPYESLFVLWIVTTCCLNDWLSELFFGMLAALMIKWLVYRSVYGYYGEPKEAEEKKSYPDPFAWMRAQENRNMQLQQTQNLCAMLNEQFDYVVEVLTWERQETAASLTKFLAVWTVLAALGYWPAFRYVLLGVTWYMFTLYPLMYKYPKAYKALTTLSFSSTSQGSSSEPVYEEEAQEEAKKGDLPHNVRKVLEVHKNGNWFTVQDKDVKFEKCKVDWCKIPVCRFSTTMKTSTEKIAAFIGDPLNAKQYDALLKDVCTVEDLGSAAVIYMAFKSPVPFVTPRDILCKVQSARLTAEDLKAYGLTDNSGNIATERDSKDMRGTLANGAVSCVHAAKPPCEGYVRGHMPVFGWIIEYVAADEIKATMIMGMDPRGSIPAKAVDLANVEQVAKMRKIKKILEGQ